MSFFDSASLVQIPSGVKDGVLYSVKPIDGSGDLTFSRGSDIEATRVNANGYIEKAQVNLLLQSNSFDTTWTNSNTTETGGQADKDGGTDAWKITAVGTGNGRKMAQSIVTSGVISFSVYAKAGTAPVIGIDVVGTGGFYNYFNLSTGAIGSGVGSISKTITAVGNGYYRCTITGNASAVSNVNIFVCDADGSTAVTDGAYLYIQDAQLNYGLVAQEYQETTTAAVVSGITNDMPRLNYDPANPTCPSLLLEPSRLNVLPQSEYYGGSEWTKTNTAVTTNATTSPEGVQNASLVYPTASSSTKWGVMLQEFLSVPSGNYTNTFYLKSNGWRWVYLIDASGAKSVWFDLQEGVVGTQEANATGEIQAMGDGWYKCVITPHTTPTTYTYAGLFFSDADNSYVCTASGTNGVYVYGAQSEAGSYPTSYIPTYGSSATRTADAVSDSTFTALPNANFTIFFEVNEWSGSEGNNYQFRFIPSSGARSIQFRNRPEGWRWLIVSDSGASAYLNVGSTTYKKMACRYDGTNYQLFANGSAVGTPFAATDSLILTNLDYFGIGTMGVKQMLCFPTALSDADCETLTSL